METNQKTEIIDPTFPVVIFPEEIRKIIDDTHEELNYPVSFISASLLFAISVAIGNCRTLVSSPSRKVKTILFMALLGAPGTAKTHAINFALAPFLKLDDENLAKYNAALKDWRKQPPETRGDKPEAKQLCVQDFTMEAITKILGETKRGIFVFVDELRGWILSFNKYRSGGGDLEQWLSLYNGCPITVNRKTLDDITFVRNPFVSVIGGLQPGLLPKLFGGEKMDNGFFFRMLFVNNSSEGEPMLWKGLDLPSGSEEKWEAFLFKILKTGGFFDNTEVYKDYSFSADAWDVITNWQNTQELRNVEDAEPEEVTAIFRKIQDYCLRFCLIIHAMREAAGEIPESLTIDENTAMKATILANYFFLTAQITYETVITGGVNHGKFFQLLNALNTEFTTAQAIAVGERMGISQATVYRYLRVGPEDPFLRKLRHGRYEKIL